MPAPKTRNSARKRRRSNLDAVKIEGDGSALIGAIRRYAMGLQPVEHLSARVAEGIARSHRDHRKIRAHGSQKLGRGGGSAAVMRHLEQAGLWVLSREGGLHLAFRIPFQQECRVSAGKAQDQRIVVSRFGGGQPAA